MYFCIVFRCAVNVKLLRKIALKILLIYIMDLAFLFKKALNLDFLSVEEAMFLYHNAALTELMLVADELRKRKVPYEKVTWIIDRNVNTTNVCIANCKFCNFYRIPGHKDAYITDIETYKRIK